MNWPEGLLAKEYATLPYLIYSISHPVLPIWINLGFDNLAHSRIIEAMLRRLRMQYSKKFVGAGSAIGMMSGCILFGCTILFNNALSKSIFQIPNISEINRQDGYTYRFEGTDVSSRQVFGATNYCGFFEVYPEIAPNVKSLICALPFSNAIMELLYSPVLQIHADFSSNIAIRRNKLWEDPRQKGEVNSPERLTYTGCSNISSIDKKQLHLRAIPEPRILLALRVGYNRRHLLSLDGIHDLLVALKERCNLLDFFPYVFAK